LAGDGLILPEIVVAKLRLPIDDVLPQLVEALQRNSNAVLQAPTGSGKTTRVAPALLDAGLLRLGRVLIVEPRRLAARAAARRVALERNSRLGDEVGYHVRFDRCAGERTRLLFVTPGVLLRYLQDDPLLDSTGAVLFDEFHERGLESDLALACVRNLQLHVRPEIRLMAISATLDAAAIARYLGDCPVISSSGSLFPVSVHYQPPVKEQELSEAVARSVERLLQQTPGDILVFLPGWSEIRQAQRALETVSTQHDLLVVPLHGDLDADEQDRALLPQAKRKIVLATNVAEASVTVAGITGVVDCGLARQLRFDPAIGLDRLELLPIARASAEQRTGRAGRTQPGICVRLWRELQHRARPEHLEPEIRQVDLSGAVLQLLALGETDVAAFPWYEPPPPEALLRAQELLQLLGATTGGRITEMGKKLARLPVTPRLGRLLLEAGRFGEVRRGALAAALLTERDPFPPARQRRSTPSRSDLLDRIEMIEEFENTGQGQARTGLVRPILRVRDQLVRSVQAKEWNQQTSAEAEPLLRALLAAYPDRLARRREAGSTRGVMVGGRGVRLGAGSGVTEGELFLCLDVDAGEGECWVRMASAVERAWLPAERIRSETSLTFNPKTERVEATRREMYFDLMLGESLLPTPTGPEVERMLLEAATEHLVPWTLATDESVSSLLVRIAWLREQMPELCLPAVDVAAWRDALTEIVAGCSSFTQLRRADWRQWIMQRLDHRQRTALEREAPERLTVPTGSSIRLQYEPGRPPVLAVKLQELFGLRDTPRLAGGRIKVILHLLAPNGRPQQITDDLASFWINTYPQVRKDLRARYPKHPWPENPLSATPQRGPKRRG
jgi:ATP-dependent helicase HrpB